MANTRLVFFGSEKSATTERELDCFVNVYNEISIRIRDNEKPDDYTVSGMSLNRSTAIKFHRELKKQISFLESEASNG